MFPSELIHSHNSAGRPSFPIERLEELMTSAKASVDRIETSFAEVVREYDRRVGRAFLAIPPEDLPAEARPLLHFGQRRGESWSKFAVAVSGVVEAAVCRSEPLIVSYRTLRDLAFAVSRGDVIDYAAFAIDYDHNVAPIAALLREVVPMTRARRGRDYARHLRDERERGKMAGVPGPVAQAVLGMVEEGVFTEERVRELAYKETRSKVKNGGGR